MSKKRARSLGNKGGASGLDVACKGSLDVKMERRLTYLKILHDMNLSNHMNP
jgi:hypothetical protein